MKRKAPPAVRGKVSTAKRRPMPSTKSARGKAMTPRQKKIERMEHAFGTTEV